jgi:hypothetical protein
MNKIFDYFDDSSGVVLREVLKEAHATGELPEFVVKSAAIPSDAMRGERTLWAWNDMQRFSVDTPADAWLSARYFQKQASEIPFNKRDDIWEAIRAGCEMHGITVENPLAKQAAAEPADTDYLVVKQAGDEVTRLYPTATREQVRDSIAWFPRNLVGELAPMRAKVARQLLDKAAEYGLGYTELLEEELAPTKRSHLLTHIQQRIDRIEHTNSEAARWEPARKAAAQAGTEPPPEFKTYDVRLVGAYAELRKMAYGEPDAKFWDLFARLDKAAGFEGDELFTPPGAMNREIEDDTPLPLAKCAGQFLDTHQLATKIKAEVWRDLAPEALTALGDMPKLASIVEALPERSQQILVEQLRGY